MAAPGSQELRLGEKNGILGIKRQITRGFESRYSAYWRHPQSDSKNHSRRHFILPNALKNTFSIEVGTVFAVFGQNMIDDPVF